jgi:hypothetical protein
VSVATSADTLKDWDIGEDDFGGPMIFHRHADQDVPAYVVDELGDWRVAECPDCMETMEFAMPTAETNR